MGVPPQTGPPKLKLFNHSHWTDEIFRVGNYEEKFPSNGVLQISKFLTF